MYLRWRVMRVYGAGVYPVVHLALVPSVSRYKRGQINASRI